MHPKEHISTFIVARKQTVANLRLCRKTLRYLRAVYKMTIEERGSLLEVRNRLEAFSIRLCVVKMPRNKLLLTTLLIACNTHGLVWPH